MNIYVANLDWGIDDAGLKEIFVSFGSVTSAKVIIDRENGRSRGFGFVEMPNDDEAREAMSELDQRELYGRPLKVVEARPKERKNQRHTPHDGEFSIRSKPFKG